MLNRYRRQADSDSSNKKEESFEVELCKDKDAGEWFRLVAGEGDNCRDVIQCTSSVSYLFLEAQSKVPLKFDGEVKRSFLLIVAS